MRVKDLSLGFRVSPSPSNCQCLKVKHLRWLPCLWSFFACVHMYIYICIYIYTHGHPPHDPHPECARHHCKIQCFLCIFYIFGLIRFWSDSDPNFMRHKMKQAAFFCGMRWSRHFGMVCSCVFKIRLADCWMGFRWSRLSSFLCFQMKQMDFRLHAT